MGGDDTGGVTGVAAAEGRTARALRRGQPRARRPPAMRRPIPPRRTPLDRMHVRPQSPCLPPPGLLEGSEGSVVLTQEEVTSEELAVDAKVARAIKVRCEGAREPSLHPKTLSRLVSPASLAVERARTHSHARKHASQYAYTYVHTTSRIHAQPCSGQLVKLWGSSLHHSHDPPFNTPSCPIPPLTLDARHSPTSTQTAARRAAAQAVGLHALPPRRPALQGRLRGRAGRVHAIQGQGREDGTGGRNTLGHAQLLYLSGWGGTVGGEGDIWRALRRGITRITKATASPTLALHSHTPYCRCARSSPPPRPGSCRCPPRCRRPPPLPGRCRPGSSCRSPPAPRRRGRRPSTRAACWTSAVARQVGADGRAPPPARLSLPGRTNWESRPLPRKPFPERGRQTEFYQVAVKRMPGMLPATPCRSQPPWRASSTTFGTATSWRITSTYGGGADALGAYIDTQRTPPHAMALPTPVGPALIRAALRVHPCRGGAASEAGSAANPARAPASLN